MPCMLSAEQCLPTRYLDGDTFEFIRDDQRVKVRVAGFDAPERGQPFGKVAKMKLEALTAGGADCDCYKTDRYGRSVCRVRVSGTNVATTMLQAGLGCIDPRFIREDSLDDQRAHQSALTDAQSSSRGMWSMNHPMCGKEFRESKRNR